jgi:hypothetical protein
MYTHRGGRPYAYHRQQHRGQAHLHVTHPQRYTTTTPIATSIAIAIAIAIATTTALEDALEVHACVDM